MTSSIILYATSHLLRSSGKMLNAALFEGYLIYGTVKILSSLLEALILMEKDKKSSIF